MADAVLKSLDIRYKYEAQINAERKKFFKQIQYSGKLKTADKNRLDRLIRSLKRQRDIEIKATLTDRRPSAVKDAVPPRGAQAAAALHGRGEEKPPAVLPPRRREVAPRDDRVAGRQGGERPTTAPPRRALPVTHREDVPLFYIDLGAHGGRAVRKDGGLVGRPRTHQAGGRGPGDPIGLVPGAPDRAKLAAEEAGRLARAGGVGDRRESAVAEALHQAGGRGTGDPIGLVPGAPDRAKLAAEEAGRLARAGGIGGGSSDSVAGGAAKLPKLGVAGSVHPGYFPTAGGSLTVAIPRLYPKRFVPGLRGREIVACCSGKSRVRPAFISEADWLTVRAVITTKFGEPVYLTKRIGTGAAGGKGVSYVYEGFQVVASGEKIPIAVKFSPYSIAMGKRVYRQLQSVYRDIKKLDQPEDTLFVPREAEYAYVTAGSGLAGGVADMNFIELLPLAKGDLEKLWPRIQALVGKVLSDGTKLTQEQLLAHVLFQILRGYQSLHSQELVHQDGKPANIFLGLDGEIRLADFDTVESRKTAGICGSPYYMSPEQILSLRVDETTAHRMDSWQAAMSIADLAMGRALPVRRCTTRVALEEMIRAGRFREEIQAAAPFAGTELGIIMTKLMRMQAVDRSSAGRALYEHRAYFAGIPHAAIQAELAKL